MMMILIVGCSNTIEIKPENFCDRYPTIVDASPSREDTLGTKKFVLKYIELRKVDCIS